VNARFQLRTDSPKFLKDYNWKWTSNPFVGKRELHGLKILTMLVSNVDAKNSNLGVFEETFNGEPRYLFATVDWGSSLGTWGGIFTQSIGNCKGFAKQNSNFIEYDKKGRLRWAFNGKRGDDLIEDISPSDVRWLLQYLGRITDHQIEDGLSASGMNSQETTCYTRALRDRIEQMRRVAAAAYQ
jgi:hypothetical protein